jgi:hypothetical protein
MQCVTALIGAYAVLPSRGARTAAVSAAAPPATLPDIVARRKMPGSVSIGMTPVINGAFRPAGMLLHHEHRLPVAVSCSEQLMRLKTRSGRRDGMCLAGVSESVRFTQTHKEAEMAQHPALAQNHRHSHEPRADEIARTLAGAEYPLGKERLLSLAEKNGADGEVVEMLNRMTNRNFDTESAVIREETRAE